MIIIIDITSIIRFLMRFLKWGALTAVALVIGLVMLCYVNEAVYRYNQAHAWDVVSATPATDEWEVAEPVK